MAFGPSAELLEEAHGGPAPGRLEEIGKRLAAGFGIVAFLKQEHGHPDQTELTRKLAELVDILFHAVADIDERVDLTESAFALRMGEHFAHLGEAALAMDLAHEGGERGRVAHPFRGPALAEPAKIDELDVEAADRLDRLEHVRLKFEREVPGGLPAHGSVHGEDEPPAAGAGRLERAHLLEERV